MPRLFRLMTLAGLIIFIGAGVILPSLAQQTGILLNTFYVSYEGRTYDRVADTTTYTYVVTGTGQPPDLSHFDLGIPRCLPPLQVVSYSPTEAVEFGIDPNTGVDGIKWGQPLKVNQSRTYTITIAGNYLALPVDVAVKDGDGSHLGVIPGPSCEPAESFIDVEKSLRLEAMTDTWLDVDEAPGTLVTINWPVYFKYEITNIGASDLTSITLADDLVDVSSCMLPASLAPNETYECEVGPFNAISGQHTNTAVATGVMDGEVWDDSDKANYFGINGPVLLSPRDVVTQTAGNPKFKWTAVGGATSYGLYLARADSPNVPIFTGDFAAAEYCGLLTCSVDLTMLPDGFLYWLFNDDYVVFLNANTSPDWYGPFTFTIDAPRAIAVVLTPVQDTASSRPTLTWTLQGNAVYSSWFLVYIAPSNNLAGGVVNAWYSRLDACGVALSDTTCSIQLDMDLINGNYTLFIQNWGPAGAAIGGLANTGFAGPLDFTIAAATPGVITDLAVTGVDTTTPTFTWAHDPNVTWYQFWVGAADYTSTAHYAWYLASDLGCNTTCTLTGIDLNPGSYSWFLQGWGAGGPSSGGAFDGWAVGPPFTIAAP